MTSSSRTAPSCTLRSLGLLLLLPLTTPAQSAAPATQEAASGVRSSAGTDTARPPISKEPQSSPRSAASAETQDKAALADFFDAWELINSGDTDKASLGREKLQRSASQGCSFAQQSLAECYLFGTQGFPKKPERALPLFQAAADAGNAYSKVRYAACLFDGVQGHKDLAEAERLARDALAPDADFSLPQRPVSSENKPVNLPTAHIDETISGEVPIHPRDQALATAYYILGEIYTRNKKLEEAQKAYVNSAMMGDGGRAGVIQAATKAALNYAYGTGTPRDMTKASEMLSQRLRLIKRAASSTAHRLVQSKELDTFAQADTEEQITRTGEQEQHRIQFEITSSMTDPKSKDYNPKEAARWLELAIEDHQSWAHESMALLLLGDGLGKPDPAAAFLHFKAATESNNETLPWCNLGICYELGIGTSPDHAKAIEIFKPREFQDIIAYQALHDKCPPSPLTYAQRMAFCLKLADKGNDQAQYFSAVAFFYGLGTKQNPQLASQYMNKALKAGNACAFGETGFIFEKMAINTNNIAEKPAYYKQAFDNYSKAAKGNNLMGLCNLARFYAEGITVEKDEDEARRLIERCQSLYPHDAVVLNNISNLYYQSYLRVLTSLNEDKIQIARERMMACLEEAYNLGVPEAALNLGTLYMNGQLGTKDPQKAYQYFDEAANKGNAMAQRNLGIMLEGGIGISGNYTEAAYHYRMAALAGDEYAMNRLCLFYKNGLGVGKDSSRALHWLTLFSEKGNRNAKLQLGILQYEIKEYGEAFRLLNSFYKTYEGQLKGSAAYYLSLLYQDGNGVQADSAKADEYFKTALSYGAPEALRDQGKRLLDKQDFDKSLQMLAQAAQSGDGKACYIIGSFLLKNTRDESETKIAMNWLRSAAFNGSNEARVDLAQGTLNGLPNMPSLEEARTLAEEAEVAGEPKAQELREKLEKRIEEEKIKAAQTS